MNLNEYDIDRLKESCIKFSREYIYDDSYDDRPSHVLYKLYLNEEEYKSIQLNPYITNKIYLFDDEEMNKYIWNNKENLYIKL